MGGNPDQCPKPRLEMQDLWGAQSTTSHFTILWLRKSKYQQEWSFAAREDAKSISRFAGDNLIPFSEKRGRPRNKSMANLHLQTVTSLYCFLAYMQVHRQRDKMGGRFDTSGYEEMIEVEEETSVHVGLITNMEIGDLTNFTSNLSLPDGQ
ncbi:hypothetical protein PoB_000609200 [Plakobranchus ocellatus]|uniref:Uncharacterized protein n=1 Tax=Plakobranchus ocellatus TaxID=259542 RepID=A0AAV3YAX1_9GAST|nr:hypothetical protein PoB_000609200 [Plakobranchus ocellatus]